MGTGYRLDIIEYCSVLFLEFRFVLFLEFRSVLFLEFRFVLFLEFRFALFFCTGAPASRRASSFFFLSLRLTELRKRGSVVGATVAYKSLLCTSALALLHIHQSIIISINNIPSSTNQRVMCTAKRSRLTFLPCPNVFRASHCPKNRPQMFLSYMCTIPT
jgi:hypothetical protein